MGHEFFVEVTEVKMFHGYTWNDLGAPCDHECRHFGQSVVAWGPTTATYELAECDECGCRAWVDGRIEQTRHSAPDESKWWRAQIEWRQIGGDR